MTLQELNKKVNFGFSLETMRKILKKNKEHFRGSVLIIENEKRTTFRILDADLFMQQLSKI